MGPFFLPAENIAKLDSAKRYCNHVIASHSVGHFPDMGDELQIPLGIRNAYTVQNYSPRNNGVFTTGATLYGETQLSKDLIEDAFDMNVRSWRSGHLCFPKILNNVLDTLGYEFNSTNSASDVLTNFPFRGRTNSTNSGVYTDVYEIPVTISDVFHQDEMTALNFEEKVSLWKSVILKNMDNYSSTVLLIHPNEEYKLTALQSLINQLPLSDIDVKGMENFGDFWKYRETLDIKTVYAGDTLKVIVPSDELPVKFKLGIVVDQGNQLDPAKVLVVDDNNNPVSHFRYSDWDENGLYIMFEPATIPVFLDVSEGEANKFSGISVFPNPFCNEVSMRFFNSHGGETSLEIYNTHGVRVYSDEINTESGMNTIMLNIPFLEAGIYLFLLKNQDKRYVFRGIKE
jgi:hypothetical protein